MVSLDLSGLQDGAAQGLMELCLSNDPNDRFALPRRQYNLGGEKLGTRDRQLPLINWREPRLCVPLRPAGE